jgi:hypothetical protein
MTRCSIHLDGQNPVAKVTRMTRFCYIVVDLGDSVSLFLPDGAVGSGIARRLAEVLLKVADENDAVAADYPEASV